MLLVDLGTLGAYESAKRYIAVGGPIPLTINTEGIEVVLLDYLLEVLGRVG